MRDPQRCACWLLPGLLLAAAGHGPPRSSRTSIRPVLAENCGACHNPSKPRNPANFLKAQTAKDIETDRGLWHNVAAQLRNRTMPPVASKLTEEDRLRVATGSTTSLRQTACSGGDYAGARPSAASIGANITTPSAICWASISTSSLIFPADGTGGVRLRYQRRNAVRAARADGAIYARPRSRFSIA